MKKIILTLSIIFVIFSNFYAQTAIDDLTVILAKNTLKKIKKLPENAKIAISFFTYDDGFKDTIKTYLGIKLSKSFAQNIRLSLTKSKSTIKILFPEEIDNNLYESMQTIFTIPDNISESDYWKQINENQTADFYFIAKYKLSSDNKTIQIVNIQITPNPTGKYATNQAIAVENAILKVSKEMDQTELSTLNKPLNDLNQSYKNLIDWTGAADFITLRLINSNSQTVDNSEIVVGKEYQISASLTEDAYIYAFFYDPMDKNFQYISMLYPYQNSQDTYSKKGKIMIPPGSSFIPDPPDGQVFIKIFATKEKIAISFTEEVDSEGYIMTKFDAQNCSAFLEKLNKLDKSKVSSRQMVLNRVLDK